MPYIDRQTREDMLHGELPYTVGELNFAITTICNAYVTELGLSYQIINDVIGALEAAKQEFYRREAVPYETDKLQENGDVYLEKIIRGAKGPGRW